MSGCLTRKEGSTVKHQPMEILGRGPLSDFIASFGITMRGILMSITSKSQWQIQLSSTLRFVGIEFEFRKKPLDVLLLNWLQSNVTRCKNARSRPYHELIVSEEFCSIDVKTEWYKAWVSKSKTSNHRLLGGNLYMEYLQRKRIYWAPYATNHSQGHP